MSFTGRLILLHAFCFALALVSFACADTFDDGLMLAFAAIASGIAASCAMILLASRDDTDVL